MSDSLNDFLELPLWFTIPLIITYIAAVAYVIFFVWHYRRTE
jgi:hypothetical protein